MHGVFDGDFHALFRGIPRGKWKRLSGLEFTSIETRSSLDSLSVVVLTARTSTSSLSQPSIRTVPLMLFNSSVPSGFRWYVLREFAGHPVTRGNGKQGNGPEESDQSNGLRSENFIQPPSQTTPATTPRDDRQIRTSTPTLHTSGAESLKANVENYVHLLAANVARIHPPLA